MDLKDKKILGELVLNSRIPLNRLAKKVGLSREVVTYRINKLKSNGIITSFHALIDEEKLGFSRNTCFIQLKGISEKKEREFLLFLKNNDSVTWTGMIIGKWNISFDILSRNNQDLEKIVKKIQSKIKRYVESFVIIGNLIDRGNYPSKIFGLSKELKIIEKVKKYKIDSTDLKILKLLVENSRIEYSELSRKLNLSANAIKYRIKNLEDNGNILGYTISSDVKKLDYTWYNIQFKLISDKGEKEIKQFFKEDSNAIYYYHYVGNENWDIDLGIIVKDSEELREFIIKFREKFPDIVKIHDVYVVLEVIKEDITPKQVFKEETPNLKRKINTQ